MEDKDFIDFKFNEHWASEFNLVAVSDGDRYTSSFYGSVSPNTTTLIGKTGVHKWNTQIGERIFNISIAYDNLDLISLRKMKEWLNPFIIDKIVFKEEPYKYYWVSLNEEPQLSFLPFRTENIVVDGKEYKKGVYKGELTLSFICVDNNGYSDWQNFDENYDYLFNELFDSDFINFSDGSDNNLFLEKIEGNYYQEIIEEEEGTVVEGKSLFVDNYDSTKEFFLKVKGNAEQEIIEEEEGTVIEGKSLFIDNYDSTKESSLRIEGNAEQETREGYNKFNAKLFSNQTKSGVTQTIQKDGTISISGTGETTGVYNGTVSNKKIPLNLKTGKLYVKMDKQTRPGIYLRIFTDSKTITTFNNFQGSLDKSIEITQEMIEAGIYLEQYIYAEKDITIIPNDVKVMLYQDGDGTYEPYGAMPSPNYPSEIKTVGNDINEFDKNSVEFEDGYYSTNGDFTESTFTNHTNNYTEIKENTDYTISGIKRYSGYGYPSVYAVYFYDSSKSWLGRTEVFYQPDTAPIDKWIEYTFKTPSNCKYLRFQCQKNEINLDLDTIKLQKGIKSTNYSKYMQGTVGLTIFNKNVAKNITYFNTKSQYNSMVNAEYYFEEGKNYRISFDTPNTGIQIYLQSEGDNTNYSTESWQSCYCDGNRHSFKVTARKTKNTKITWGLICRNTETNDVESGLLSNLMIERVESNSSDETEYVEHQESSYILPVQQEMLQNDYFVKEEDNWKEVHNWEKYIFTGNENFRTGVQDNVRQFNYEMNFIDRTSICNYFKNTTTWWTENTIIIGSSLNAIYFQCNATDFPDIQTFKNWLTEKYNSGNPVIIYYKLAASTKLPCTSEQNTVLDELNDLDLFEPVTNIITTENIALLNLKYNYVTPAPSPKRPSSIKCLGSNKNLFDKDNANLISLNAKNQENGTFSAATNQKHIYIECKPLTSYSITKSIKDNSVLGIYETSEIPAVGINYHQLYLSTNSSGVQTITTSENIKYLDLRLNTNPIEEEALQEILDTLKIEEGEMATSYSSYNMGSTNIKILNKNMVDLLSKTLTVGGWHVGSSYNEDKVKVIELPYDSRSIWNTYYFDLDENLVGETVSFSFDIKIKNLKYVRSDRFRLQNSSSYDKETIKDLRPFVTTEDTYVHITKDNYTLVDKKLAFFVGVLYNEEYPETDTVYVYIKNFQIEKNSVATDYIEYQEENYTLPVQQEMLEGDYFIKEIDGWKEVHNWSKINVSELLSKDIGIGSASTDEYYVFQIPLTTANHRAKEILCEKFKFLGFETASKPREEEGIAINQDAKRFGRVWIKASRLSEKSISAFLSWCAEENIIVKALIENNQMRLPTTLEQSEVLDKLNNLKLFEPTTNIITTEDIALLNLRYNCITPSPNPKKPSEIKIINNPITIKQTNKNLLNDEIFKNTTITDLESINSIDYQDFSVLRKGKNYSCKILFTNENYADDSNLMLYAYDNNKQIIDSIPNIQMKQYDKANKIKYVKLIINEAGIEKYKNETIKGIQIQLGENTEYQEHKERTYTFPIQQELFKEDYIDFENNKEVHYYTKKKLSRADNWFVGTNLYQTTTIRLVSSLIMTGLSADEINCYSTHFLSKTANYLWNNEEIGIAQSQSQLIVRLDKEIFPDTAAFNYFIDNNDVYVYYKNINPIELDFTEEQKAIANNFKNDLYSYLGTNNILFYGNENTDCFPKATIKYIPEQNIYIDFVTEGSNLLNSSSFYYDNNIHLKSYEDFETGNPETSGITSSRAEYLYNAGNEKANLNLTFDYIPPQLNAPLEINIDKVKLTSNGWETVEEKFSSMKLEYFTDYKPFTDLLKEAYSLEDLSSLPENWQNDWQLEINSDIKEIYFKNKTNKDLIISLNKFNSNQNFLQLCESNFVDYSKPFPTLLSEVDESAIQETYFNKIYLTSTIQNYRLKNICLDWKHTYI